MQIVVPILVFRNHNLVNPFGNPEDGPEAGDFLIDMKKVEEEVRKMLLPRQKMTFVKGLHFLHDHKTISLALQKATKSKASPLFQDVHQERYPYIDTETLLHELGHSDDLLAAGLFGTSQDSTEFMEVVHLLFVFVCLFFLLFAF